MRIGVIADTHVPTRARSVPDEVAAIFDGVDLILHAGDLEEKPVLEWLARIAPVEAVLGNMDPPELEAELPVRRVVEAAGFRIGLVHGSGPPSKVPGRAVEAFAGETLDLIVYGHSHRPDSSVLEGRHIFNPGSPTDRLFAPYLSVGILTLDDGIIPEIVRIK